MAEQGEYGGPSFGGPSSGGGGILGDIYNTVDKFTEEYEPKAALALLNHVVTSGFHPGWALQSALLSAAKHGPSIARYLDFDPQSYRENLTGDKSLGHDQVLPDALMPDYPVDTLEHYTSPIEGVLTTIMEGYPPIEGGVGRRFESSQPDQSVTYNNVVDRSLREAAERKKTDARDRAKALAKETARLKAKEEHRIQVLKDRADKKAAEEQWNPNIVPEEEVTPVQLPPMVINDGPTTHEANVAKREATKARIATARGKTKSHLAKLRSKGVSAKTMAKAKSKAKARYAKIKSR